MALLRDRRQDEVASRNFHVPPTTHPPKYHHPMQKVRRDEIITALGPAIVGSAVDSPELLKRVDDLLLITDDASRAELESGLWLFDSALIGLLLCASPRRFSTSSSHLQRQRLSAFQQSSIPKFRTLFLAMQRLIVACHYSQPAAQRATGYEGPKET